MQRGSKAQAVKLPSNSLIQPNELRMVITVSFLSGMAGGLFMFILIANWS